MKKDAKRKGKPVAEREKSRPLHFTDTSKPTPQTSALEVRTRKPPANMVWTFDQLQMIRDQYAKGSTEEEFKVLMGVAAAKGLDPLRRQIYFRKQKEWDREANGYVERWIWMTSIDGLRSIADRTGLYDGQDRPEFEYVEEQHPDGGKPIKLLELALVNVWRKDITRPFVGEARYAEFVQQKADGTPNQMWQKMLHNQLAKCAEALALRKAFPDDCNLYVPEEFAKQDEESAGARYGSGTAPAAAAPAPSRADQLAAEIEKCETTAACDELAQRMVSERLTGMERKVLGELWKRQRDELEKGAGYARQ